MLGQRKGFNVELSDLYRGLQSWWSSVCGILSVRLFASGALWGCRRVFGTSTKVGSCNKMGIGIRGSIIIEEMDRGYGEQRKC